MAPPGRVLLLAPYADPTRDLLATTLGRLLRDRGDDFDVYYAAHRGGGLFSPHGGTLLGGRHHAIVAEALARRQTTSCAPGRERARSWRRTRRTQASSPTTTLCSTRSTWPPPTGVKLGIGVHAQRYAFDPNAVEAMQVPQEEGGALGLCEPVLHSTGLGIMVESLCPPATVASLMTAARARIADLAGERFVPRGVYCFCDAAPERWDAPEESLWKAIRDAGFAYVISTVRRGPDHPSQVLYRDPGSDFVVLSQVGYNCYPYSPFFRVELPVQFSTAERVVGARRGGIGGAGAGRAAVRQPRPGWMIGVLDIPLYGYTRALSIPSPRHGGVTLGDFFGYILKGGEAGRVDSATPHTIARYARLCQDLAPDAAPALERSAGSSGEGGGARGGR